MKSIYTPHGGSLHYSSIARHGPVLHHGRAQAASLKRRACCSKAVSPAIAMSSSSASRIARGASSRMGFIRTSSTSPCWPTTRWISCSSASFRYLKGVDILLEALAAHQAVFPGRALIVGSGPEEASLKRLARKLGLNGRVSFAGPQSARSAFARARCVVMPSRAESFPYIVLEAAAARMPLITTDAGGIPEIVDDLGMPLIPPGDVEALAGQLRAFLVQSKSVPRSRRSASEICWGAVHRREHDPRHPGLLHFGPWRRRVLAGRSTGRGKAVLTIGPSRPCSQGMPSPI